jgi:hypothetical protein
MDRAHGKPSEFGHHPVKGTIPIERNRVNANVSPVGRPAASLRLQFQRAQI